MAEADIAFARELFTGLSHISHRKMMDGAALYCDGVVFASLDGEGPIYLRAEGKMAKRLGAEDAEQFSYTRKQDGKTAYMAYWSLPDAALDDPGAACDWARQAMNARH